MMKSMKSAMVFLAGVYFASVAQAQRTPQPPQMVGEFKPVVGSGAQYEITMKDQKTEWIYAVVGKESVEGGEAYWLEMRLGSGKGSGMVMKHLMLMRSGMPEIKRMIVQSPGQRPMEMPMMMGGMMKMSQPPADKQASLGEKVGTESVTVPAGTFVSDHYRVKSGSSTGDVWISTKVAPYGMVKMVSGDTTMVLTKVLENETSHIQGEPQKIELPHF